MFIKKHNIKKYMFKIWQGIVPNGPYFLFGRLHKT